VHGRRRSQSVDCNAGTTFAPMSRPDRTRYGSFFSVTDPDGNTWLAQQVTILDSLQTTAAGVSCGLGFRHGLGGGHRGRWTGCFGTGAARRPDAWPGAMRQSSIPSRRCSSCCPAGRAEPPYHPLREITTDPWREIREGNLRALADAELARVGVRRPDPAPRRRHIHAPGRSR
jgi:hypothetical protein